MPSILVPAEGTEDWRRLLADPDLHWRPGYSAYAIAHTWQAGCDFPPSIRRVFQSSDDFRDITALLILPEHRVPLPGGRRPSQNDVWVLARCGDGLISVTVEGKARETFGPRLGNWREDASPGKQARLAFLTHTLGLSSQPPDNIRYQLLHRTASAIIEANRFFAKRAVMLVQSFSPADDGFDDYSHFAGLFGVRPVADQLVAVGQRSGVELYFAWVRDWA